MSGVNMEQALKTSPFLPFPLSHFNLIVTMINEY